MRPLLSGRSRGHIATSSRQDDLLKMEKTLKTMESFQYVTANFSSRLDALLERGHPTDIPQKYPLEMGINGGSLE